MTKTYNDALEWAATWIEDTLKAGPETNERTVEFGTNMAMTLRAAKLPQPAPDAGGEWRVVPEPVAPMLAAIHADGKIIASCMTTETANQIISDHTRAAVVPQLVEALKALTTRAEFALSTPGFIRGRDELKSAVQQADLLLPPEEKLKDELVNRRCE